MSGSVHSPLVQAAYAIIFLMLVYGYTITTTAPYTGNPFYILVNLAIGANGGDPSSTTFPITYLVDYLRVYQKP